jgi:hypothetical protein
MHTLSGASLPHVRPLIGPVLLTQRRAVLLARCAERTESSPARAVVVGEIAREALRAETEREFASEARHQEKLAIVHVRSDPRRELDSEHVGVRWNERVAPTLNTVVHA